ncbi:unnamed protein product [Boreogadus saida]
MVAVDVVDRRPIRSVYGGNREMRTRWIQTPKRGAEVRAALHPKSFITERPTHDNTSLALWVSPQFDQSHLAAPPGRRGRRKGPSTTSILDRSSQLSRKPGPKTSVCKFPTLSFDTECRLQNGPPPRPLAAPPGVVISPQPPSPQHKPPPLCGRQRPPGAVCCIVPSPSDLDTPEVLHGAGGSRSARVYPLLGPRPRNVDRASQRPWWPTPGTGLRVEGDVEERKGTDDGPGERRLSL